jgi:uncharacterized membrane protein
VAAATAPERERNVKHVSCSSTIPSSSLQDDIQFRPFIWLLLGLTLIALILRLYRLDNQSFWLDEAVSLVNANTFGSTGLAEMAAEDQIAPLHSIVLWLVTRVATPSEFALRLPSAIFGAAVVPVLGWLVYDMFRSRTLATVASLLTTFSPYAIWYSQEARMYSLYLFLSVVFVALSWRASERPFSLTLWISLVCVSVMGLYTHHFMALLSLSFGLYLLGRVGLSSARLWWWASTQAVAATSFLYWLYLTTERLGTGAGVSKPAFVLWIPYSLVSFSFGPTLGPSTSEIRAAGLGSLLSFEGALVCLAIPCAAYLLYRGLRAILRNESWQPGVWCTVWLMVPVLLAVTAAQFSNISYNPRYVIVSLPPLMILLAAGIVSILRSRNASLGAVATLAILTVIALSNLYWNTAYAREDVRPLAQMLRSNSEAGNVLVFENNHVMTALAYYGMDYGAPALGGRSSSLTLYVEPRGNEPDRTLTSTVADLQRVIKERNTDIWLIQYREWEADPTHLLQSALDHSRQIKEKHSWPGVALRIYGPGTPANKNAIQQPDEKSHPRRSATSLIPADRATTWNPGLNAVGGIPRRSAICATVDASTYGNGTQNAANGIQEAINKCPAGQVVMLSAGDFRITNRIMLNKGITLRGQGPAQTKLKMPRGVNDNSLISIGTEQWTSIIQSTNLASDGVKGSQSVTLHSNPGLMVGEIVLVDQLTDSELVSWGSRCPEGHACRGWFTRPNRPLGQVMEVAAISGSTVTFTTPFHIDFQTTNAAQLSRFGQASGRLIPAVKYAGVEDLYLSGGNKGSGNISMSMAAYSWIKNIESDDHSGHSVALNTSFRSVVRDSYIHSAQESVPGGNAYGLVISKYSSDNLIENNIVWRMNKVMVMQSSGGGNVIAYNYMDDGHIKSNLSWMESGINASHMVGSHMELFEGNQSFSYDAEHDWGSPIYITVFRNHLTGKRRSTPPRDRTPDPSLQFPSDQFRRTVGLSSGAWWHTLVGNVLGYAGMSPAPAKGFRYEDTYPWSNDPSPMWRIGVGNNMGPADPKVVSTLLRGGNYDYVTNELHWENIPPQALPDSLYLTSKPTFFGTCTWPWVDPAGQTKVHTLPARTRFDAGRPNDASPCSAQGSP